MHRHIAASKASTVMVKTHNMLGAYEGRPLHNITVTSGAMCVVRNLLVVVVTVADHFGLTLNEAIEFMSSEATGTPNDENL